MIYIYMIYIYIGTPQFWAPEQILPGNTFWGKLLCPRDCPIQIDAPIIDQVDAPIIDHRRAQNRSGRLIGAKQRFGEKERVC
jgi:hypothetical protein